MYEKFYRIASLVFRLSSDFSLNDDEYSSLFRIEPTLPDISVNVSTVDELPNPHGTLVSDNADIRIFRDGDDISAFLMLHGSDKVIAVSSFSASQSGDIAVSVLAPEKSTPLRIVHIWSVADICFALLFHDRVVMHSSSVRVGDGAVLFAAPSGTGKSTQAELWRKYRGAEVLNGDKNCVMLNGLGNISVCGLPFCGTSGICLNYELPISAVVILSQSKSGDNDIRRLGGIEALTSVMRNCMGHSGIQETAIMMSGILSTVVQSVPVFAFSCTPDERAVIALEKFLAR